MSSEHGVETLYAKVDPVAIATAMLALQPPQVEDCGCVEVDECSCPETRRHQNWLETVVSISQMLHIQDPQAEEIFDNLVLGSHSQYETTFAQRAEDLSGDVIIMTENTALYYEWIGGYETLRWGRIDTTTGEITFTSKAQGSYHPGDGTCKTVTGQENGLCMYCGRTLM